ncbi:MAG: hypothetical protein H6Q41_4358 [Deltaproteobacteria bacterium]|jgi:hypothetical protein|nr:hypothetical protein [Deltaproteobacteria bacterium]
MRNIKNLTTIFCVVKEKFYAILQDVEIFGEKTPSEITTDLFPSVPPQEVFHEPLIHAVSALLFTKWTS